MRLPLCILSLAAVASAQINTAPASARAAFVNPSVAAAALDAIPGRPYSAQKITEHVQTLADGTRLTQTREKVTFYRDSQGRTRVEHINVQRQALAGQQADIASVEIFDPIDGTLKTLDPLNHTGRQLPAPRVYRDLPPVPPNAVPAPRISNATADPTPQPQYSREDLGTRTIEGLLASGVRLTTVYPVDYFGNDRPFSATTETWSSPELNMVVLTKNSDPRSGDTTISLTNISRAEPDPSLFQVPPDYQITNPH